MKVGKQVIVVIIILLIGLSAGWAISSFTAKPRELIPVKFTTGWIFDGNSAAPLLLGAKKGFFAQEGINVDIVRGFGSADVVSKVAAGTYEAGRGDTVAFIDAKSKDPSLDLICLFIALDANPNALTGLKGRPNTPKTPKEIEGKKISAVAGSTAQLLFPAYAKAAGIDPTKVTFVTVAQALVAVMVDKGETDLCTGFITTGVNLFVGMGYKEEDLQIFVYYDYLPTLYGNSLMVRKSWAEKYPAAAKGLVRAYINSLVYTYKHPEEAIDVLLKREPLLMSVIETRDLMIGLQYYYFTDKVLKNGMGYQTSANVEDMIKMVVEGLELKRTPSVDEIYTTKYLPAPEERQVK